MLSWQRRLYSAYFVPRFCGTQRNKIGYGSCMLLNFYKTFVEDIINRTQLNAIALESDSRKRKWGGQMNFVIASLFKPLTPPPVPQHGRQFSKPCTGDKNESLQVPWITVPLLLTSLHCHRTEFFFLFFIHPLLHPSQFSQSFTQSKLDTNFACVHEE